MLRREAVRLYERFLISISATSEEGSTPPAWTVEAYVSTRSGSVDVSPPSYKLPCGNETFDSAAAAFEHGLQVGLDCVALLNDPCQQELWDVIKQRRAD